MISPSEIVSLILFYRWINFSDKLVDSLNLDDEAVPGEMNAVTYANLLHEFKQENSSMIDTLEVLVEHYNPENNEQYRRIIEQCSFFSLLYAYIY